MEFRIRCLLLFLLTMATAVAMTMNNKNTKMLRLPNGVGVNTLLFRPYSYSTDWEPLDAMCYELFGGWDYLPAKAETYASDPDCDFMVLQDYTTGSLVATGNLRTMDPPYASSFWLEAIRVSPQFQGRGVCTLLIKELCQRAQQRGANEILSCAIDTNEAMKTVFGKPGINMVPVAGFDHPEWADESEQEPPQNIVYRWKAAEKSTTKTKTGQND